MSSRVAETSTKLRVDNLHYDLTERDLRVSIAASLNDQVRSADHSLQGLFNQQGPVLTLELVYDRAGRSTGQAYVTYESSRDAEIAIREYDGAKAMGQYIKVTRVPTGPSMKGRGFGARTEGLIGSSRSLFERVERRRSESPRRSDRLAPDGVDRYVPRDRPAPRRRSPRSRSPPRRGRGGRGGRGRGPPRTDGEGRALVGGRPRKSANDLDAEMEDYWGGNDGAADDAGPVDFGKVDPPETAAVAPPAAAPATAANGLDEDIDMIE